MPKIISFPSIVIASLLVTLVFITSTTYLQLGVGILLYITLVFLGGKVLPRKRWHSPEITVSVPSFAKNDKGKAQAGLQAPTQVEVSDIDKRAFLKLIGAAGLSFFMFSLLNRRSEVPFLGKIGNSSPNSLQDTTGNKIDPAERQPLDGYQISEIDDNLVSYYGFTHKNDSWFIIKEDVINNISFRYAKGDSKFPQNWANRENLNYDYFSRVF